MSRRDGKNFIIHGVPMIGKTTVISALRKAYGDRPMTFVHTDDLIDDVLRQEGFDSDDWYNFWMSKNPEDVKVYGRMLSKVWRRATTHDVVLTSMTSFGWDLSFTREKAVYRRMCRELDRSARSSGSTTMMEKDRKLITVPIDWDVGEGLLDAHDGAPFKVDAGGVARMRGPQFTLKYGEYLTIDKLNSAVHQYRDWFVDIFNTSVGMPQFAREVC
jgi:hypothetical protein